MSTTRQQLLYLQLSGPDPESRTIGWALYDSAIPKGELQMNTGDSDQPIYDCVLDAMRDGWNVLQVPVPKQFVSGYEHEQGHLIYEFALERKVTIHE